VPIDHELNGWRRSKFASQRGGEAHLRIIFRIMASGEVELVAFGDRAFPQSVYFTAKERL
jgi:hypothetical protein